MSLTHYLARFIANYDSQNSIASKFRTRRAAPLMAMIEDVHKQYGAVNIIDIGGTENYWGIIPAEFLDRNNVSIALVNLPSANTPSDHGRFTFHAGDGCDLSAFKDGSFHIAHSNSVVEHVGDWNRMQQFAKEVHRVAQRYFVQTPNFWFPIEPHCMTPFFHWLPRSLRMWLVRHFQLGHWRKAKDKNDAAAVVDSARLLNKAQMRELFHDGTLSTERLLLLPKSFIAVKAN